MLSEETNFVDIYKWMNELEAAVSQPNPYFGIERCCSGLKNALNRLIPGLHCFEVKYTKNFDKPFFGVYVVPGGINSDDLVKMTLKGYCDLDGEFQQFPFSQYSLELDGKFLRDIAPKLTSEETWAIIYNEILNMCSAKTVNAFRIFLDNYVALNGVHICPDTASSYPSIFDMMMKITMRNMTSLFAKTEFFVDADMNDDITQNFLSGSLRSAIEKLVALGVKGDEIDTTGVLMSWYFNNYERFDNNRYTEYMFRDSMDLEPSSLVRNMYLNALKQITRISEADYKYYAVAVNESGKKKGLLYQMKRNGLKSIEEDLFEYNMRLRNVETQDDAILLMRQINSRMSILEDYLREEDMDEKDRERWEDCYKKYLQLRTDLSKKTVYNKKMYGLFVDYNALQNMSQTGQLMNTYY